MIALTLSLLSLLSQSAKTTMVAALPSSVTKFEQKAVINIETAEVTSLVSFESSIGSDVM
jgi:hypothetical protein